MFDVLIVEDDPMVAMINKQYVMRHNAFRVCGMCKDGVSALDFLSKKTVDLIILDQFMPRMTGLEFLRELRRREMSVSIIMVTAANDTTSIEEALTLGVIDYLVKPFSNSRFNQALTTFLSRKEALSDKTSLNQKMIDDLMNSAPRNDVNELPKGIQIVTLNSIREYLKEHSYEELTGESIADGIGMSRVTVRRYMTYLVECGEIAGRMNYETGGRPSMLYRHIN